MKHSGYCDILKSISTSQYSLTIWCGLLNYFEINKDQLSVSEITKLAELSEKLREYFNTDRSYTKNVTKNGHTFETQQTFIGMNIAKEDVIPNIHHHLNLVIVRTAVKRMAFGKNIQQPNLPLYQITA